MKPATTLAASLPFTLLFCLSATAFAQAQTQTPMQRPQFTDPANLSGEQVAPITGRELPIDGGEGSAALGLQQLLRKIDSRASLMLIVAHPDDEDSGMLTFYSRGMGARVADLALNRGEGGQNAMTADFEDALGLIRTQELLAEDRYSGTDQFFGTEVDFGFSKTKEEAFAKWTHDRVLYDAVRSIRIYRPLVIASVFIGGVTDGHGHHQVSGQIAQEAFKAAGDPSVFPELTAEGILPWQPLKVYARVPREAVTDKGLFDYATNQFIPARFTNYVTGEVTTTAPTPDVIIHEGQTDLLLTLAAAKRSDVPASFLATAKPDEPLSYIQFAHIGLGLQKSQMGREVPLPETGEHDVAYHLYGDCTGTDAKGKPVSLPTYCHADRSLAPSSTADAGFFTGIDTSLTGIAPAALHDALAKLHATIGDATAHFSATDPSASAPQLADALRQTRALIAGMDESSLDPTKRFNVTHELRVKEAQIDRALQLALGLTFDATADATAGVTGQVATGSEVKVHLTLTKSSAAAVSFNRKVIVNAKLMGNGESVSPEQAVQLFPQTTPTETSLTLSAEYANISQRPYFHRADIEQPIYTIDPEEAQLRNAPESAPSLLAWMGVRYLDTDVLLARIVHDGNQPVSFVPPVSIVLVTPGAMVLPHDTASFQLIAALRAPAAAPANVNVQSPSGWTIEATSPKVDSVDFQLRATAPFTAPALFRVSASTSDHVVYTEGFRAVGYPSLVLTNFYKPATERVVPVDLKLSKARIAYLPGTGDSDAEALASIGLAPTILSVADLLAPDAATKLKAFDTILLGIRTYSAHPDLHGAATQALLDYARGGGNVVVQFQTAEFTAADAPYPLTLGASAEKVVDETDAVKLLEPTSPLLTSPNVITPADFDGWVAERGHGFLGAWDAHYTALTETHDPGAAAEGVLQQTPQRGGLITAPLGKGRWTYCAFALYRQLPEANPGAFRLLVNLINP